MTEGDVLLLLLFALAAGGIGGAAVAGLILWARTQWPRVFLRGLGGRYDVPVDVRLRAEPVALKVAVEQPEAVAVPIVVSGAPSTRELAARVIGAWPEVGPQKLAEIVGCSKSTAHAILQDHKAGKLTAKGGETDGEEQGAMRTETGVPADKPAFFHNGRAMSG